MGGISPLVVALVDILQLNLVIHLHLDGCKHRCVDKACAQVRIVRVASFITNIALSNDTRACISCVNHLCPTWL